MLIAKYHNVITALYALWEINLLLPPKNIQHNLIINKSNTETLTSKVKPLNVTTDFIFPHSLKTAEQSSGGRPAWPKA
jgi:hypothetical protein